MTALETDPTLCIATPADLNASNVSAFREHARTILDGEHTRIDVDMSRTTFVDSSGLGALISLHKMMTARGGSVRLLNPMQPVLQLIELTRMHRIFEIVRN
jgi:anti-sigma B factor antagonist